ncbi:hypothetical protein HAX54_012896 [Datura stramonium]|uniref:Uncharacterized protein n=1 Tax=Datura stramonium TaxID=4076 RepID=A0ABS8RYG0_DATST|nr:hypothetical protein [Datura stramonium]
MEIKARRRRHRPLLTGKSSSSSTADQFNLQQSNQYYSQICRDLEAEKKKKESVEASKMVNNGGFWWNEPIDDMGIEELEEFMVALGEVKRKVTMRADELSMINGPSSLPSSSNSTLKIARFGAEDHILNEAIDYFSSSIFLQRFSYLLDTPHHQWRSLLTDLLPSLSARPVPPNPRISENTNSTARRSFSGNPFSRPSKVATQRGFNSLLPPRPAVIWARRCPTRKQEGLGSSSCRGLLPRLLNPLKEKSWWKETIPLGTSITLSDGKATFFSATSEEHNQNSEVGFEHNKTVKSLEGTENVMEPPKETVTVEGLPPVTKPHKRVTFLEVPSNCNNASEALSDTVTMDSGICNDEPLVSPAIAPLDADPSLPPYDPRTNYLSPRPQANYKPNPRIEVLLNKEKGLDVGEANVDGQLV